ncbi:MAG: TapY2 family type IVa secretion system protein [Colwellia sp.]|nr:TapY2 family type IVa secretion system protein [Colwellia sp.]
MNGTIKSITFLLTTTISLSGLADPSAKVENEKKVNAKCYVELVGGGETISLWRIQPSLLKSLKRSIIGQEILVIGTHKKANIYRAKECVLEEDKFKNVRARLIDKDLPR